MTDLPTREQFAAMILENFHNGAIGTGPLTAAYSAALARIEELEKERTLLQARLDHSIETTKLWFEANEELEKANDLAKERAAQLEDAVFRGYTTYVTAMEDIEVLKERLAIAVNAAGVQEARATAAEQGVERLREAIVDAVSERVDDTAWLRLVAIAAEGDGDATLS